MSIAKTSTVKIVAVAVVCLVVGAVLGYEFGVYSVVREVMTCSVCGMAVTADTNHVVKVLLMGEERSLSTCCPGCALMQYAYLHLDKGVDEATLTCPDRYSPNEKVVVKIKNESIESVTPPTGCFFMSKPMACAGNGVFIDRTGAEKWKAEKNPEGMIFEGKSGIEMWLHKVVEKLRT